MRFGAVAAALCVIGQVTFAQTPPTIALTPQQMLSAAQQEMLARRPINSAQLAQALVQRPDAPFEAFVILAQSLFELGQYERAQNVAQQAWQRAATREERFLAALLQGRALQHNQKYTRANYWNRMAHQLAATPQQKRSAQAQFAGLRHLSPWSTKLAFAVSPTSNINGGSKYHPNDIYPDLATLLGGLTLSNNTVSALSGTRYFLGTEVKYATSQSKTHKTELFAAYTAYRYQLSDDAKAQAPDAKASDYAFDQVNLGVQFQHRMSPRTNVFYSFDLGLSEYAHGPLHRIWSAQTSIHHAISPKISVSGGLKLQDQHAIGDRGADVRSGQANLGVSWSMGRKARAGVGVEQKLSLSDTSSNDYQQSSLTAHISWQNVIGQNDLSLSARRDFAQYFYVGTDQRKDIDTSLTLSAKLDDFTLMGFAPKIDWTFQNTSSNQRLYEADNRSFSVTMVSAF